MANCGCWIMYPARWTLDWVTEDLDSEKGHMKCKLQAQPIQPGSQTTTLETYRPLALAWRPRRVVALMTVADIDTDGWGDDRTMHAHPVPGFLGPV